MRGRRLVIPCLLLVTVLFSSLLAGAAVRLPARWVPGDAAISPAAADQSMVSLAPGGGMVLALWSDNRANSTGGYEGETSRDIYALRLDGNGTPLDAVPFAVTAARASQEFPRAAFNGTNWLVVFESYDLTGTGGYYQKSLAAVRVAPDGRVLDAAPIRILNVSPVGAVWAVASDGKDWVVAMQGSATGGDLTAVRISAAGVLLDPNPRILVKETYYLRGTLRLAFAGGVYLMTYDEAMTGSSETSALRFDASLTPLDPAPLTLLPQPIGALISNGSGFYAIWTGQLPDYSAAVFGTRIDTAGQVLDGTGVNISGTNSPAAYTTSSVAWDGNVWKATWGAAAGTRLARIGTGGQVLDPGGVSIPGPQTGPSASVGNGSVQLAWTVFAASTNDVLTANIASSNVAGPTRTASVGAPSQSQPDLATGTNGFMLVYRSMTSARHRILAQPLDAAGNPLTAEPTEVDAGDPSALLGSSRGRLGRVLLHGRVAERERRRRAAAPAGRFAGRCRAAGRPDVELRLGRRRGDGGELPRRRPALRLHLPVHQPRRRPRARQRRPVARSERDRAQRHLQQQPTPDGAGRALARGLAGQLEPRRLGREHGGDLHRRRRRALEQLQHPRPLLDRRRERDLQPRPRVQRQPWPCWSSRRS